MDFSLFHEPNLSDPNPQTADIKSGYRGRESRTKSVAVQTSLISTSEVSVGTEISCKSRHTQCDLVKSVSEQTETKSVSEQTETKSVSEQTETKSVVSGEVFGAV